MELRQTAMNPDPVLKRFSADWRVSLLRDRGKFVFVKGCVMTQFRTASDTKGFRKVTLVKQGALWSALLIRLCSVERTTCSKGKSKYHTSQVQKNVLLLANVSSLPVDAALHDGGRGQRLGTSKISENGSRLEDRRECHRRPHRARDRNHALEHRHSHPGRRFNRNIFGLSFGSKNGLRFHFDSETCLSYPFLNIFLV